MLFSSLSLRAKLPIREPRKPRRASSRRMSWRDDLSSTKLVRSYEVNQTGRINSVCYWICFQASFHNVSYHCFLIYFCNFTTFEETVYSRIFNSRNLYYRCTHRSAYGWERLVWHLCSKLMLKSVDTRSFYLIDKKGDFVEPNYCRHLVILILLLHRYCCCFDSTRFDTLWHYPSSTSGLFYTRWLANYNQEICSTGCSIVPT